MRLLGLGDSGNFSDRARFFYNVFKEFLCATAHNADEQGTLGKHCRKIGPDRKDSASAPSSKKPHMSLPDTRRWSRSPRIALPRRANPIEGLWWRLPVDRALTAAEIRPGSPSFGPEALLRNIGHCCSCSRCKIPGPKPDKFIGFRDIHGPKPYKFIGFGDIHGPQTL